MKALCVLCSLLLTFSTNAQKPCSPKDQGPFLATLPTLSMDIAEATQQDLVASPQSYRAELRVNGVVNGQGADGIVLEVMPDYTFFNPEDTFRFVSQGGVNYAQMYMPLDRDGPTAGLGDDTNVFSFTLKCTVQSNISDVTLYDTNIFVTDVNDNDPEFVDLDSILMVNELTPVNTTVLRVTATDKDVNENMTYSVLPRPNFSDDLGEYFEIAPNTQDLKLVKALDYETMSAGGMLVITATDSGTPAQTATATLQVQVVAGDDQGPVFVYEGCWQHRGRCAWPKFTASTVLKIGEPIAVMPVPNKVKASVPIKARDLDVANTPVVFSIASTIPPGSESMFTVSTSQTSSGAYQATITPKQDMTVNHGFEIFLQAEEQSSYKRFEIAMILFEDPNNACASSASQTGTSDNSNSNSDDKYSEPVIALIVVVAILAAFMLCLAIAVFCISRKSRSGQNDDVALQSRGISNGAYNIS